MSNAIRDRVSREEQMVVIERDERGKPKVWCDPEIADIVAALNASGILTIASCSGHGRRPGRISLRDGREIFVATRDEAAVIDGAFTIDINGMTDEERAAMLARDREEGGAA